MFLSVESLPLQSLRRLVQRTASKRPCIIGYPHSSQMPKFSCRIRIKASSMARKSLLSLCSKWICVAAAVSLAAITEHSAREKLRL